MAQQKQPTMTAANTRRVLNVYGDLPDIRDRIYEPALVKLDPTVDNREPRLVLDQGREGACTGFGLAAVINLLNKRRGTPSFKASARMLYEMAKKHDAWPGEDYAGSSCRGAIRGWMNMGVCSERSWPYVAGTADNRLTIERAREARHNTLGAYYRLRPEITDYHAALNEVGAVYVSAKVHSGWNRPRSEDGKKLALIKPSQNETGGHAFAIVGYMADGFIVQNSWGPDWGQKGFALWLYEDWLATVMDGWVFRLALPTAQIFNLQPSRAQLPGGAEEAKSPAPERHEIAGHFVHFDDGHYKPKGDYWSTGDDVRQTAERLASSDNNKYGHLMVYAHGGLNSPEASARRVRALKDGFKRNGIYPYHIMYDTGLVEEVKDVVKRALGLAEKRVGGFSDFWDGIIEDMARKPVTPIWEEMKRDARLPFEVGGDGSDAITAFATALADTGKSIHLVGHSTGGILLGHLLGALDRLGRPDIVASCSLMAPACTIDFYKEHFRPRLGGGDAGRVRLPIMKVYNLNEKLEEDDTVASAYCKSLLFLVSRALERSREKPILGMRVYSKRLRGKRVPTFIYSDGDGKQSASTTHGGFDNDANTMNDILKTIVGGKPKQPFDADELTGF